jgi:hypothetical protein
MIDAQDFISQAASGNTKVRDATSSAGSSIRSEFAWKNGKRKLQQSWHSDVVDGRMSDNMIDAQDAITQAASGYSKARDATSSAGGSIRSEAAWKNGKRKLQQSWHSDVVDGRMSDNMIDAQDFIAQAASGNTKARDATSSAGGSIRSEFAWKNGKRKLQQSWHSDVVDGRMSDNMIDAQDFIAQAANGNTKVQDATSSAGGSIRSEAAWRNGKRKLQLL